MGQYWWKREKIDSLNIWREITTSWMARFQSKKY